MVLPKFRTVLFAHGCFWHGHQCHLFKWPKSRAEFWRKKITRNVELDEQAFEALRAMGWRVGIVWECALKGRTKLGDEETVQRLADWLPSDSQALIIEGR